MMKRLVLATLIGLGLTAWPAPTHFAPAAVAESTGDESELDELIMNNGDRIHGWILSETATDLKIRMVFAGIESEVTFPKSDILVINRAEDRRAMKDKAAAESAEAEDDAKSVDPEAKIYFVELKGVFGEDVSQTPLRELFDDIDDVFGDKVERLTGSGIREVVDPAVRDKHIVVIKMNSASKVRPGQNPARTYGRAENMGPIIEAELEAGRRIVFWVKEARGGAAFLPWLSGEMYFTQDGEMGGIIGANALGGDAWVREKLAGAVLGHMKGFAVYGGYADHVKVIEAMARPDYWLRVKTPLVNPPRYSTTAYDPLRDGQELNWVILSDDGKDDRADQTFFGGNDTMTLTAHWAQQLGIAKGLVDTMDALAEELGVGHNYLVLEDADGADIFEDWRADIDRTWRLINWIQPERPEDPPIGTLWVEFNEIEVGGDYKDRTQARSRRIRILKEITSKLTQYAEVWDPTDAIKAQFFDVMHQIELEQMVDTAVNRANRQGGGGDRGRGRPGGGKPSRR